MQEIRKINDFYEMIEHDKVLVIFYADWSGPADILLQVTEDLKEDVSLLASYNDNQSSDSYLHIYYEDGVVKDALYGPYKIDNLDNVIVLEIK